jgi:hypothetical protein
LHQPKGYQSNCFNFCSTTIFFPALTSQLPWHLPTLLTYLPTIAAWRMNGKWWRNNFLLGFSSLANHDG